MIRTYSRIRSQLAGIFQASLLAIICLTVAACAPRGETKNLDQVLEISQSRYTDAKQQSAGKVSPVVSTTLGEVEKDLTDLVSEGDDSSRAESATKLESSLKTLITTAGYTSRPAMDELIKQYRSLGTTAKPNQATGKLIASRTYHLLASELETTRFAL